MNFAVPAAGFLHIPYTGLSYMLIFFHEIGHTVFMWLFGYPAIPQFDFEHGGGFASRFARSWTVLAIVWAGAAALAVQLYRSMHYRLLAALGVATVLHVLFALTRLHDVLISFMGHGTEILIGAFCMLRAFWNTTEKSRGAAERWLNMVFGIFAMIHNMVMTAGLMLSDISRSAYALQKGGHLQGDLDRIALSLNVSIQSVAGFLFLLSWAVLGATVYLGRCHAPHNQENRI